MDKTESGLKVTTTTEAVSTWKGDALLIGVYEEGGAQPALAQCGPVVEQEVQKILKEGWIRGKMGETLLLPLPANSDLLISRLVLLGMGKKESLTAESFRVLGGHINNLCNRTTIKTAYCLLTLDTHRRKKQDGGQILPAMEALAEGAWLSSYRFEHFKSDAAKDQDDQDKDHKDKDHKDKDHKDKDHKDKDHKDKDHKDKDHKDKDHKDKHPFKQLVLGVADSSTKVAKGKRSTGSALLAEIESITRGVTLARDLGNLPGNLLNPEMLVQEAQQLATRLPTLTTTIYTAKILRKKGMNGILAVGNGSASLPQLLTLEYHQGGDKPLLAVVGKGVTFDSGGICLKPGSGMEDMKFDMCGGAAVLGFMQAIAEMQLPINVVGIVPAAENLPSATAQRPGDIIKTAKGVFVEVINTDAEGRLILADALHHAASFKPKVIIDLATLTGACVVALGSQASGLFGNDPVLLRKLQKAGEATGERLWPLPLFAEYQEQIKSTVADIKNVGDKTAGAITAACFLSRFIEEGQAWAHIDIAGTAWDTSGSRPYVPKGAVGVGVRLLCRFVQDYWV